MSFSLYEYAKKKRSESLRNNYQAVRIPDKLLFLLNVCFLSVNVWRSFICQIFRETLDVRLKEWKWTTINESIRSPETVERIREICILCKMKLKLLSFITTSEAMMMRLCI
jgi:hypothetical protein